MLDEKFRRSGQTDRLREGMENRPFENRNIAPPVPAWGQALSGEAAGQVVASMADVVLVLDQEGVIRDVTMPSAELAGEMPNDLRGRSWIDTVTMESRPKVAELVRGTASGKPARHREINHPTARGLDVPIRYSVVPLGEDGRLIAVGRDLRALSVLQRKLIDAQEAMEREYARMRAAETRYRMLFHLANEPVLVVEAETMRIVEANPSAERYLTIASEKAAGRSFLACFSYEGADAIEAAIKTARRVGHVQEVTARLAGDGRVVSVGLSVFRQEQQVFLLVRLSRLEDMNAAAGGPADERIMGVIEHLPDGFVVVDGDLRVLEVNQAFLDLVQLGLKAQALGETLGTWLGRPGVDLELLLARLSEGRAVRSFFTIARGAFGSTEEVELSAVPVHSRDGSAYGFVIRNVGLRQPNAARGPGLHRSVEQLTELVGRVSLKELVRESADMIERLCIEAALERSRDNRASAAQMLGLSRQSFYAKMRRHGLGDLENLNSEEG